MNNIRKIIEERLDNDLTQEEVDLYTSLLIEIPAPRTEQEILKDFEKLGYKIINDSEVLRLKNNFIEIYVYKQDKEYGKEDIFSCEANRFTLQEHKLLNELFEVWQWI